MDLTKEYITGIQINNKREVLYCHLFEGISIPEIDKELFEGRERVMEFLTIRMAIYNSKGEGLFVTETVCLPTIKDLRESLHNLETTCLESLTNR
jgi:hypothetical protein